MAFVLAPDFRIRSVNWSLSRPAQVNVSSWTGKRTVVADPWHGKWRAEIELAPLSEEFARPMRSFFARCRGQVNTFRVPATPAAQNANTGVSVASTAAAGATTMTITGAATPMLDGQFVTVNGQLLLLTADQSGTTLAFEPPLRVQAAVGKEVHTSLPYALVHLSDSTVGWATELGPVYGMGFSVEEALLESDRLLSTYALALDFSAAEYWAGGTSYVLASVPGYAYTRSGAKSELNSSGSPVAFAANEPGVVGGLGYWSRASLTNILTYSQQLDHANWLKGASTTVTADFSTAPDGTTTAERVEWTSGGGAYAGLVEQNSGVDGNGKTWTVVAFVRSRSGGNQTFRLKCTHAAVTDHWSADKTATGVWQLFTFVQTFAASAGNAIAGISSDSTQTAADLDVWQVQCIEGDFPDGGPIIATTTAAAAVGADDLRVTDSAVSADQLFWASADFTNASAAGIKALATFHGATADERIHLRKNGTSLEAVVVSASVAVYTASAVDTGDVAIVLRRVGGNWRGGYVKAGVLTWFGADTAAAFPSGLATLHAGHHAATIHASVATKGIYRKLGTFDTDAKVLAAVSETS